MLWRVSLNLLEHSLQRLKEIFSFLPICVLISSLAGCEHPKNSQMGFLSFLNKSSFPCVATWLKPPTDFELNFL